MGRRSPSPSPSPSRSPSWCHTPALKRGPWTPDEDRKLLAYIQQHGRGSWRCLPLKAGLQRCGKSCRLRWTNYLRPDIKRGKFSLQEEQTIIQLHALVGNKWSAIATHLPNRTDNEIKNYWNTHLKKRLAKMGIDPVTHKPTTSTNLSHMAQWENARLEAEARLRQTSTHHHQLPLGPKSNIATHAPHIVSPTSTLSFLRSVSTISGVVEMESSHIAPLLVTFQFPTEIQGFGFGTQQCDMDHPIYSS